MLRILQLLIVCLWLTTTFHLVRRSYFPDDARFPEAPVDYVSSLFFKNTDQPDLIVLQGDKRLGQLTITPRRAERVPPTLQSRKEELREIFFVGLLAEEFSKSAYGQVTWNGTLYVDSLFRPEGFRLVVRSPSAGINAEVMLALDPPDLKYRVKQSSVVLLHSDDMEGTRDMLKEASELQGQTGLDLSVLDQLNKEELHKMISSLEPTVDCRHGQFRIQGDRYEGYIVKLSLMDGVDLRLFISELGELLKLDGIPNVEILGDAFVTHD